MSIEETTTKVATTIINNDVPFISKYLLGLSKNNSKSNNENDNYDVLLQQWTMPFCSNIDIITDGIRSIMQCERDYILSQLPQFYIDRFGVIGSSDSYDNNATNSVDCSGGSGGSRGRNRRRYFQILNPYQIPPGDIRTEWMKEFVVVSSLLFQR